VTFTLEYSNTGGFESAAWITNTFVPEAAFVRADPEPDDWDTAQGLWARWDLGALAADEAGTIAVTVAITPELPPSTTLPIWDGIFNHLGELEDQTELEFHVAEPSPPAWMKWVDGLLWAPGLAVTAQTSDTIEIVDVVISGGAFKIEEIWEPEHLALVDWELDPPGSGSVLTTPFSMLWDVPALGAVETFTLTKRFHVEPCTWPATELTEELWVGAGLVERRQAVVLKEQPQLWIQSISPPLVYAGRTASFTLSYGNTGGFESTAWIVNEFPPEAPFGDAVPYPDEVAPNKRLVRWNLGSLATGAGGSIAVTVSVTSALPASSTVVIWDGIFNHIGVLEDETFITTVSGFQLYLPLVVRAY